MCFSKTPQTTTGQKKKFFKKSFFKHDSSSIMHLKLVHLALAFKRYRANTIASSCGFDRKVKLFCLQKHVFWGPLVFLARSEHRGMDPKTECFKMHLIFEVF